LPEARAGAIASPRRACQSCPPLQRTGCRPCNAHHPAWFRYGRRRWTTWFPQDI